MSQFRRRYRLQVAAVAALAVALMVVLVGSCDPKKPTTTAGQQGSAPTKDAEMGALAPLESEPSLSKCRTALLQLDHFDSAQTRPVLSDSERADVTAFLSLTPAEVAETSSQTFRRT